ncbi:MAG: hypothetical protein J6031_02205 [Bacteroidales bacterium]|nr:hypothetical protein [Bacteroidales bacterium]
MDEIKKTGMEYPQQPEFPSTNDIPQEFSKSDLFKEVAPYYTAREVFETKEYVDEREFGLKETVEAAKEIFTPQVISEWGNMTIEQRSAKYQEYQHAVAEALGIEAGNVIFKDIPGAYGYNNGDGNVYLNTMLLEDPQWVIKCIDTIAHETRHQFQHEAVLDPERFGISPEVAKEWAWAIENYTQEDLSQYDPWGYHYNPIEIDSRYFGESVVRELTKDLINDYASLAENTHMNEAHGLFINDREWNIKQAEKALADGDLNGYRNYLDDASKSTK